MMKIEFTGFTATACSLMFCFLSSCGGSGTETKTESGSDLLKNTKAYDRNAIDPNAQVVEILLSTSGNTMAEMKYDKDTIAVREGTTVSLTFMNGSVDMSMQHNFVLVDPESIQQVADEGLKAGKNKDFIEEGPLVYVHTKMTVPGETTLIRFPAPPAGVYKFVCTYPGHYSIMQGWFIVEKAGNAAP